ncbi:cell division protein [Iodidimonas muriae]|uniref:Cell division protein n=1 Tax=Iodidimonas muriae TaxID=261467 RepID=A0ABQ2LDT9_9PROT|nr:cell division protein [Iodidimonas muriae]GGO11053.1 cell division protein [Iodidimonas muriae]
MRLRRIRFLPARAIAGGALPWVIGTMVFLCALATGFAFAMNNAVGQWADQLSQQVSVQIVTVDEQAREEQASAAIQLLNDLPGISLASRVSTEDSVKLLEPWLGAGNVTADLPIPILIDVAIAPDHHIDLDALTAQVRTVAPNATLDDHERWLDRLNMLTKTLQSVALLVVVLILGATAAIAAFGTRAGLASHRASIEIMHLMGATDDLIAGEFRYRFMLQGLKGGSFGLLAGLFILILLRHFASRLGSGLVPTLDISLAGWLSLIALPGFAAFLTLLAAHLTVRRELARMP